jgi:dihydropteroate synthase
MILNAIFELELVSSTAHAGYLGRELKQAEIALKLGRSYAQDDTF